MAPGPWLRQACRRWIRPLHQCQLAGLGVGLIHSWMLDPSAFDLAVVGRRAIEAQLAGLTRTIS